MRVLRFAGELSGRNRSAGPGAVRQLLPWLDRRTVCAAAGGDRRNQAAGAGIPPLPGGAESGGAGGGGGGGADSSRRDRPGAQRFGTAAAGAGRDDCGAGTAGSGAASPHTPPRRAPDRAVIRGTRRESIGRQFPDSPGSVPDIAPRIRPESPSGAGRSSPSRGAPEPSANALCPVAAGAGRGCPEP